MHTFQYIKSLFSITLFTFLNFSINLVSFSVTNFQMKFFFSIRSKSSTIFRYKFSHVIFFFFFLSVIMQKGEFQKGCFKKTKHAKFSKYVYVSGGKKCSFFGKLFGVLCFPETPVLRFVLLPY